jgi:lipid A 3-O-deacylase
MRHAVLALTLASAAAMSGTTHAGELFAGVYSHDIDDQISHGHFETGPQILFGARTTALDELSFLGRPRVHLLFGVNTQGGTDYVASGLTWRLKLTDRFYFEPGVGVAVHDGKVGLPSPDDPGLSLVEKLKRQRDQETKLDLGSRVLFEPELSLGWKATNRISAEVSWVHLSHAQLAGKQNPGLGDFGLRLLYRYGLDR